MKKKQKKNNVLDKIIKIVLLSLFFCYVGFTINFMLEINTLRKNVSSLKFKIMTIEYDFKNFKEIAVIKKYKKKKK
jgi:hypothetical protein